jgi:hypothetical protein
MRLIAWLLVIGLVGLAVMAHVGYTRWSALLASEGAEGAGLIAGDLARMANVSPVGRTSARVREVKENVDFCLRVGLGSGGLALLGAVILAVTHRRRRHAY